VDQREIHPVGKKTQKFEPECETHREVDLEFAVFEAFDHFLRSFFCADKQFSPLAA
jgi:hypothetical protein